MLTELAVRDLGTIESASLVFGEGMTVLTGETGAGKTMIVQAIQLLVGGRADPTIVRSGAAEAVVEGRFLVEEDGRDVERVIRRVVPCNGRSRAYIDGDMATVALLAELGAELVDLHGQHQHQSLLSARVQRRSLDAYGAIDLADLTAARDEAAAISSQLAALGGDERSRSHEIDLLRYQLAEIDQAAVDDADELLRLAELEDALADAAAHIAEGHAAREGLSGDGGAADLIGAVIGRLAGRGPFAAHADRLRALAAELADVVGDLRSVLEGLDDDPARLAEVRSRRQLLRELTRKYGDTLADVMSFRSEIDDRLGQLERHEEVAAELEQRLAVVRDRAAAAAKQVAEARRLAAPTLGNDVTRYLPALALDRARVAVAVSGPDPADEVAFLFAANSGTEPAELSKVASGGELARVMLALRLVLTAGPPTLVFDEVDAGVGGEAAVAVGRSLGRLGADNQVLVVTHLPQVAAFADHQVVVRKVDDGSTVSSGLVAVTGQDRITELARMLAGRPDSAAGRDHAAELLALADSDRARR